MKILKISQQYELQNIPSILYHATFKPLLKSIKKNGLGNYDYIKYINWENNNRGVWLHRNTEEAKDYVETSENENIPEEWFDQIIAIPIKTINLDLKLLIPDPELEANRLYNDSSFKNDADSYDSFLYKGIIYI